MPVNSNVYMKNVREQQPFHWRRESYCMSEVCRRFGLPQVVQFDQERSLATVDNPELQNPLLVYSARAVRKVSAVAVDNEERNFSEEPILIPKDYNGWFSILKPGYSTPYFSSINSIAVSNVTSFLVTCRVPGFQIDRDTGQYTSRSILPGDILRVSKIYSGKKAIKEKSGLFRRKKIVEVRYLLCIDVCEREVLFGLDQKGSFYAVTVSNDVISECCIMKMEDILKKLHFPVNVRHVYGRKPLSSAAVPTDLRLDTSFIDDSVIAFTMTNDNNGTFLELPKTDSPLRFKMAVKNPHLTQSDVFVKALHCCEEGVETYMKDIKVSLSAYEEQSKRLNSTSLETLYKPNGSENNKYLSNASKTKKETRYVCLSSSQIAAATNAVKSKDYVNMMPSSSEMIKSNSSQASKTQDEDYENIWDSESKQPLQKKHITSYKKAQSDPLFERSPKKAFCRLSFDGTYIHVPNSRSLTSHSIVKSARPKRITIPLGNVSDNQHKSYTRRLLPSGNSFDLLDSSLPCSSRSASYNVMMRSSSEGDLRAQLQKSTEPQYQNSGEIQKNSSPRVLNVEQALRISVYGDIEGWDVVNHDSALDTQHSLDSGYISMSDVDITHSLPVMNELSPLNEQSMSCLEGLMDSETQSDLYTPMNELTDGYAATFPAKAKDTQSSNLRERPRKRSLVREMSIESKSILDVADLLRHCGIRDVIVQKFIEEKVDGKLLMSLENDDLKETFPLLRAIETKKIHMIRTIGWIPNDKSKTA